MVTLPNLLSLSRVPLAFAFLNSNPLVRIGAILLALISDGLDGFLARRWRLTTPLGTLLDPCADRFFVIFAIVILGREYQLEPWKLAGIFSRDFAILLYGLSLTARGRLTRNQLRAIWCGKATTVLQLFLIFLLCSGAGAPDLYFYPFFLLGFLALLELYLYEKPS